MAIDLTSDPLGWGPVIASLGRELNSVNRRLGDTDLSAGGVNSLDDGIEGIATQFAGANISLLDGLYAQRDSHRLTASSYKTYLKQLAQAVTIKIADDDVNLVSKDITTAMKETIAQAVSQSESIDANTVSVAVTPGTNPGSASTDPVCLASVTNGFGVVLQTAFAETIDVTATTDAQTGGTVDSETWSVRGDAQQSDVLAWDWPKGSGCSTTTVTVDPSLDAQLTGNLLTNSDFETWTVTDTPDNWTILVGAASTDILRSATAAYIGTYGIEFAGTAATILPAIAQTFNVTTGTNVALKPNTVYAVHWRMKASGALTTGAVSAHLYNGSNAVINDDAGTANTITVIKDDITTSFKSFGGFFRTPRVLPTTGGVITIKFVLRVSTDLTNGESVYIDDLAMAEATQCYAGGPYVRVFRGSDDVIKDDTFAVAVSNNQSDADMSLLLERFFDLRAKGLQFPYDSGGSETIPDSLLQIS